jgi:hypothetical protein
VSLRTVKDSLSPAHSDIAIVLACRAIQSFVDKWNATNSALGHAVALRFGGDEILLCVVLHDSEADIAPC